MESRIVVDPSTGQRVVVPEYDKKIKALKKDIRAACDEYLSSPDWGKNMAIIDLLNGNPWMAQTAISEIRLQLKTKNPEIEILALTLTEGIVKNCASSHASVANADFMRYLVKVALNQRKDGRWKAMGKKMTFSGGSTKTTSDSSRLRTQTIEKALLLIRMLGDAYKDGRRYPIFAQTHRDLTKQGVRFPKPTKDETLLVFSPPGSAGDGKSGGGSAMAGDLSDMSKSGAIKRMRSDLIVDRHLPMIRPVVGDPTIGHPKLRSAQDNAAFLFEMINNAGPETDFYGDELIAMLVATVREDQKIVQGLASDPSCQEVDLLQALQVNEVIIQVLDDRDGLAMGTKRRYVEEIDVSALVDEADEEARVEAESLADIDPSEIEEAAEEFPDGFDLAPPPSGPGVIAKAKPKSGAKLGSGGPTSPKTSTDLLDLNPDAVAPSAPTDTLASAATVDETGTLASAAAPKSSADEDDDLLSFMGSAMEPAAKPTPVAPKSSGSALQDLMANSSYGRGSVAAASASVSAPPAYGGGAGAGGVGVPPMYGAGPMAMGHPQPVSAPPAMYSAGPAPAMYGGAPMMAGGVAPMGSAPMMTGVGPAPASAPVTSAPVIKPQPFVPKPYVPASQPEPAKPVAEQPPAAFDMFGGGPAEPAPIVPIVAPTASVAAKPVVAAAPVSLAAADPPKPAEPAAAPASSGGATADLFGASMGGDDPFAGMGDPFSAFGGIDTSAASKGEAAKPSSAVPSGSTAVTGGGGEFDDFFGGGVASQPKAAPVSAPAADLFAANPFGQSSSVGPSASLASAPGPAPSGSGGASANPFDSLADPFGGGATATAATSGSSGGGSAAMDDPFAAMFGSTDATKSEMDTGEDPFAGFLE